MNGSWQSSLPQLASLMNSGSSSRNSGATVLRPFGANFYWTILKIFSFYPPKKIMDGFSKKKQNSQTTNCTVNPEVVQVLEFGGLPGQRWVVPCLTSLDENDPTDPPTRRCRYTVHRGSNPSLVGPSCWTGRSGFLQRLDFRARTAYLANG